MGLEGCASYFGGKKDKICGVGAVAGMTNAAMARTAAQGRGRPSDHGDLFESPQLPRPRVALLLLWGTGCAASTVRVPIADGASETRETQKLDCGVYDERTKSLTVGLSFTALFGAAAAGPYVTSAEAAGVKWGKATQIVVAQYKEVCSRYNAGAISQPSYDSRISEIDQLYAEAQGIRASADAVIRGHSKGAFADLDKNTDAPAGDQVADAQQVVTNVEVFYVKVGGH